MAAVAALAATERDVDSGGWPPRGDAVELAEIILAAQIIELGAGRDEDKSMMAIGVDRMSRKLVGNGGDHDQTQ